MWHFCDISKLMALKAKKNIQSGNGLNTGDNHPTPILDIYAWKVARQSLFAAERFYIKERDTRKREV